MRLRRSPDVTERDAFGNPIGDDRPTWTNGDPLGEAEAVGTAPAPAAAAPPIVVGAGTVPTPRAPRPPRPPRRARRRVIGGLGGLIGLLLFLGPFLVGGWFVYRTIHDTVDHTTNVLRDLSDATTTVGGSGSSDDDDGDHRTTTPPRGLGRHSLLAPTAVNELLRKVRANPGGKLQLLRLAPDRANLQLTRPGGMSLVQLGWDGSRTLVRTPGAGPGSTPLTFSKIDRHAPQRLVRAAAHRLGRKTTSIDYLVLIDVLDGPRWSAYFTGGAAFQGDAHGHLVRRIS
jgi:hypothetical protein